MAYYARKTGHESYTKRKARENTICFSCKESIIKGDIRYVCTGTKLSLCNECMKCWLSEGGILGAISRNKTYRADSRE